MAFLFLSNLPRVLAVLLCRAGLGFGIAGGILYEMFLHFPKSLLARGGFFLEVCSWPAWILLLIPVPGCPLFLWDWFLSSFPVQLLLPLVLPIPPSA